MYNTIFRYVISTNREYTAFYCIHKNTALTYTHLPTRHEKVDLGICNK